MKWPFVTRAKYDRQIGYAKLWEKIAKREQIERERDQRLAQIRVECYLELLRAAERRLARFERRRGESGKFKAAPSSSLNEVRPHLKAALNRRPAMRDFDYITHKEGGMMTLKKVPREPGAP